VIVRKMLPAAAGAHSGCRPLAGFTLLELLMMIVIIDLLAIVVGPKSFERYSFRKDGVAGSGGQSDISNWAT